jgi:uncharacterized membrane protein YjfL (UPF0719 family)
MAWQTILFICAATIVLLAVARFVNQLVMHTRITEALIQRDNPAVGIQVAGYLLGVIKIIASVLSGEGHGDFWMNTLWVAVYGIGGILFLTYISTIGLQLFLSRNCMQAIREGNVAAGIVAAGSYIGTGSVISGSFAGEGSGTLAAAVVFFVAGQVAFLVITYLFRLLTAYNDAKEILNGNIPAALSYAGVMVAVGIIVGNAVMGDFVDYATGFIAFGKALLVVLALYPIRQWLVQGLLLGGGFRLYGGSLDEEISRDRNINAGVIEAATYIGAALLVTRLV